MIKKKSTTRLVWTDYNGWGLIVDWFSPWFLLMKVILFGILVLSDMHWCSIKTWPLNIWLMFQSLALIAIPYFLALGSTIHVNCSTLMEDDGKPADGSHAWRGTYLFPGGRWRLVAVAPLMHGDVVARGLSPLGWVGARAWRLVVKHKGVKVHLSFTNSFKTGLILVNWWRTLSCALCPYWTVYVRAKDDKQDYFHFEPMTF